MNTHSSPIKAQWPIKTAIWFFLTPVLFAAVIPFQLPAQTLATAQDTAQSVPKASPLRSDTAQRIGVWDLMLMNRYLLGLTAPQDHSILTTDADASGSLSGSDIGVLLKSILNTTDTLSKDTVTCSSSMDCLPNWTVTQPLIHGKKGDCIALPLLRQSGGSVGAWQLYLDFDPTLLTIEQVEWPANTTLQKTTSGWHCPYPGHVRLLWWDPLDGLEGLVLGQLRIKLLKDLPLPQALLRLHEGGVLYAPKGQAFSVVLNERQEVNPAPVDFSIPKQNRSLLALYPNPTQGHFRLNMSSPVAESAVVTIWDMDGKLLRTHPLQLKVGPNTLTSAQLQGKLPAGQYEIRLSGATVAASARLVVY